MRRLALLAPLALTSALVAGEPGFWMVHDPNGAKEGYLYGLSQDGLIAVGTSWGWNPWKSPGFSWTAADGRYDFGLERGMPTHTWALAISSDGGTIVGMMGEPDKKYPFVWENAYRRVGNGPLQDLGKLANWPFALATGVSGDGQIIVGTAATSDYMSRPFGEPFRWTAQSGMIGLGHLKPNGKYTTGLAISSDGTTIVGSSRIGLDGPTDAYRWTEQTKMVQLPDLRGIPADEYGAQAVNADGSVIVGYAYVSGTNGYPVRWANGGVENLGDFGYGGGRMYAVDDSGNVIGGQYAEIATVWTPATGLMFLADYLAGFGIHAPAGLTLANVNSISGDGLTFGGWVHDVSNHAYSFVATIPAPCAADCDQSGQLDIDDFICFQTLFALGDAAADCDKSGELDFDDFMCFNGKFVAGCP